MTRITESEWVAYYGFQRFPFDRPEAGNEEFARPDFLAACFVEPGCFERILGQADAPVTAMLFAARGTGKTACRVMVDYFCRVGQLPSPSADGFAQANYVLSIPHVQLHRVLELARMAAPEVSKPTVLVEHHVTEIMSRAMPPLVELLARIPELREAVENMLPSMRQDLGWLIFHYRYHLSTPQIQFLRRLRLWLPMENQSSVDLQTSSIDQDRLRPLPGTVDVLQSRQFLSPLDHLSELAQLIRQLGIGAIYVLVDGVDEFAEGAGDPQEAYRVIRPLLTTLRLMDSTPYLAFKFFLPDDLEPLLWADKTFRRDRGFIVEQLQWQESDLIAMLRRRLAALKLPEQQERDRIITGFDALCTPDLKGQIEEDMARWAAGNPRHLMLLGGLMVTAHCTTEVPADQDDPYQLNRQDWIAALAQYKNKIAPTLRPMIRPLAGPQQPLSVQQLIQQGEGEHLEFKSSLRWDINLKGPNKKLQEAVAKTIAGMMNRYGGTLLIGVADDGTILGIEDDLKTLNKKNQDSFQFELGHIIDAFLGPEYRSHVQVRFQLIEGKRVCIIDVASSPTPVYIYLGNIHEFWVRLGNSTQPLDTKAAHHYIQSHWRNVS